MTEVCDKAIPYLDQSLLLPWNPFSRCVNKDSGLYGLQVPGDYTVPLVTSAYADNITVFLFIDNWVFTVTEHFWYMEKYPGKTQCIKDKGTFYWCIEEQKRSTFRVKMIHKRREILRHTFGAHTRVAGTELDRAQNESTRKSTAVEQDRTSYFLPRAENCLKSNGRVKTDPCHQSFTTAWRFSLLHTSYVRKLYLEWTAQDAPTLFYVDLADGGIAVQHVTSRVATPRLSFLLQFRAKENRGHAWNF
jgi:hypothetical protein